MKDQIRLTIAISRDLYDKLVVLTESYGMSKSALVAYYVGRSVDTETRIKDATPNLVDNLMKMMLERGDIPDYTDSKGNKIMREVDMEKE